VACCLIKHGNKFAFACVLGDITSSSVSMTTPNMSEPHIKRKSSASIVTSPFVSFSNRVANQTYLKLAMLSEDPRKFN